MEDAYYTLYLSQPHVFTPPADLLIQNLPLYAKQVFKKEKMRVCFIPVFSRGWWGFYPYPYPHFSIVHPGSVASHTLTHAPPWLEQRTSHGKWITLWGCCCSYRLLTDRVSKKEHCQVAHYHWRIIPNPCWLRHYITNNRPGTFRWYCSAARVHDPRSSGQGNPACFKSAKEKKSK